MRRIALLAGTVLICASSASADIVIDTVTVGNPGNPHDTYGYGGVDYAYSVGKYEVTAGQYAEFLNAVAATDSYGLWNTGMWYSNYGCKIQRVGASPNYSYIVANDWADRPVNYVTWYSALRFANWMHNGQGSGDTESGAYTMSLGSNVVRNPGAKWFLPTENEWYKAAYHKNDGVTDHYFDYPTSSDTWPGYVNNSGNLSGTNVPFAEGGVDPGNYATINSDGGSGGIGIPYYRTEVGEWENSDSPYGTFDQGGNVWEWNETLIGSNRGLRGGSYINVASYLTSSERGSTIPHAGSYVMGFRVASDVPEPATLSMLALGGLAILRRRR